MAVLKHWNFRYNWKLCSLSYHSLKYFFISLCWWLIYSRVVCPTYKKNPVNCDFCYSAKKQYQGSKTYERCEMIPVDGSLTRSFMQSDSKDDNTRAWQQSVFNNQSLSRSLQRNNPQMIIMDKDLITINGINQAE